MSNSSGIYSVRTPHSKLIVCLPGIKSIGCGLHNDCTQFDSYVTVHVLKERHHIDRTVDRNFNALIIGNHEPFVSSVRMDQNGPLNLEFLIGIPDHVVRDRAVPLILCQIIDLTLHRVRHLQAGFG